MEEETEGRELFIMLLPEHPPVQPVIPTVKRRTAAKIRAVERFIFIMNHLFSWI